jgi:hypothetical protein
MMCSIPASSIIPDSWLCGSINIALLQAEQPPPLVLFEQTYAAQQSPVLPIHMVAQHDTPPSVEHCFAAALAADKPPPRIDRSVNNKHNRLGERITLDWMYFTLPPSADELRLFGLIIETVTVLQ